MQARWIRMTTNDFEGSCASLAAAQHGRSAPVLAWAQAEAEYRYSLIAPRLRAPGKESRWLSWGLSAAVATYREFGYPAVLDRGISLYGRRIADASIRTVGGCVLVASSFLARFPRACIVTPSAVLEQAFRQRLEAQHGWQFDHSWPTVRERVDYAVA